MFCSMEFIVSIQLNIYCIEYKQSVNYTINFFLTLMGREKNQQTCCCMPDGVASFLFLCIHTVDIAVAYVWRISRMLLLHLLSP